MAVNYPPYYAPQPMAYAPQVARPQFPAVEAQPQIGIKGRPVSSLDEVRATSIDFDGSIFYFPDIANKCIYTKQINVDGTSTLNVYELKAMPAEPALPNFVTREELDTVLSQFKESLIATKKEEQKKDAPTYEF